MTFLIDIFLNEKENLEMKKNNKGFSLVELIIVIAIMAVLMAVLAPQFLRYVERSRLQSDNTAIGEVANACKIACTDEAIAAEVVAGGTTTVTITLPVTTERALAATDFSKACPNLLAELTATIPTMAVTSNTYTTAANAPTVVITITDGVAVITGGNYIAEVGAAATNPTF